MCLCFDFGGESFIMICDDKGVEIFYGFDLNYCEFLLFLYSFLVVLIMVVCLFFGELVCQLKFVVVEVFWVDLEVEWLVFFLKQICEMIIVFGEYEVILYFLFVGEKILRSFDWLMEMQVYISCIVLVLMQQKVWCLFEVVVSFVVFMDVECDSVWCVYEIFMVMFDDLQKCFLLQGDVLLIGYVYIDFVWLWLYCEMCSKLCWMFYIVFFLMECFEGFCFNQLIVYYYVQIVEDDLKLFDVVLEKVKIGQWEIVGGMWIEFDMMMLLGESLVCQIFYGQCYFEKIFGVCYIVCWLFDCFGFFGVLFQFFKQGGFENFFIIKVNWLEMNCFLVDFFWWEGFDGSWVLIYIFDNMLYGYNGELQFYDIYQIWCNYCVKDKYYQILFVIGYGDGGGGVMLEMLVCYEQFLYFLILFRMIWGYVVDFFDDVQVSVKSVSLLVWCGEIYFEFYCVILISQSVVKWLYCKVECSMIMVEMVLLFVYLFGGEKLVFEEVVWCVVLKNEFYDILFGFLICEVYEDVEEELMEMIGYVEVVQKVVFVEIVVYLLVGDVGDVLLIVNLLFDVCCCEIVMLEGVWFVGVLQILLLGVVVVLCVVIKIFELVLVMLCSLENGIFKVMFVDDGMIESMFYKLSGCEVFEGCGNWLMVYFMEKFCNWDVWDIEGDYMEKGEEIIQIESFEVIEYGMVCGVICIVCCWCNLFIMQVFLFVFGLLCFDIEMEIDWYDCCVFLCSIIEIFVRVMSVIYECVYGVLECLIYVNCSWDVVMFEVVGYCFVDFFEIGFGVVILNDVKYGYSMFGNVFGFLLLCVVVYFDLFVDEGYQCFIYLLMLYEGVWYQGCVCEEVEVLNQLFLVVFVIDCVVGVWQLLLVDGVLVGFLVLKMVEDGEGLILCFYELVGCCGVVQIQFLSGWQVFELLIIMEELFGVKVDELKFFEVKSWWFL